MENNWLNLMYLLKNDCDSGTDFGWHLKQKEYFMGLLLRGK